MRYCLLLLLCVAIASCSAGSDTIVNGPASPAPLFKQPQLGTRFMLHAWEIDNNGTPVHDEGRRSLVVTDTATNYFGKDHVTRFRDDSAHDLPAVNFESDGSISVLDIDGGNWHQLPIDLQETHTYTDSNEIAQGRLVRLTYSYAGKEDIVLANHRFSTIKITRLLQVFSPNGVQDTTLGYLGTFWYARELGWYVKYLVPARAQEELESYEPK